VRVCARACVCSLSHPACKAHAPYWRLWPVRLYHIFPHYPINCTIFGWKLTRQEMCIFSLQLPSETFLILRITQRDIKHLHRSSCYSCQILRKLEYFRQISKNYWNTKFHENSSSGSRVCFHANGQTRTHDEVMSNSHFSQFCESSYKRDDSHNTQQACMRITPKLSRLEPNSRTNTYKTQSYPAQVHSFLTSELDGGYRSVSRSSRFTPGNKDLVCID
jgi:hypothetical protein